MDTLWWIYAQITIHLWKLLKNVLTSKQKNLKYLLLMKISKKLWKNKFNLLRKFCKAIKSKKNHCRYPLYVSDTGDIAYFISMDSEKKAIFRYSVTLPPYVTCSQCVIQWTYYTGIKFFFLFLNKNYLLPYITIKNYWHVFFFLLIYNATMRQVTCGVPATTVLRLLAVANPKRSGIVQMLALLPALLEFLRCLCKMTIHFCSTTEITLLQTVFSRWLLGNKFDCYSPFNLYYKWRFFFFNLYLDLKCALQLTYIVKFLVWMTGAKRIA